MKLHLERPFISINEFPDVDLPPFTLITGLNGSGKTHLLKAIQAGHINTDLEYQGRPEGIRFFDASTFVIGNSGLFASETLSHERENQVNEFESIVMQHQEQVISQARQLGVTGPILNDLPALVMMTLGELTLMLGSEEKAKRALDGIFAAATSASQNVLNHLSAAPGVHAGVRRKDIEILADTMKRPVVALTRSHIISQAIPSWGENHAFSQSLSRLFVAYRDVVLRNQLNQNAWDKGRRDVVFLTDEQFIQKHMIAPWLFVNASFRDAGLDFEINIPDEFSMAPFEAKLKKISTGARVKFDALSAGEKILLSLALCLYYAEDKRQPTVYPKLLLLDEVDAPLHPAMSKTLLDTIVRTLIGKHGIQVIATTHSPSTVALAPDQSVYAMYADKPGLHHIGRAAALNFLTSNVPTLALSYQGRRQVFVESPYDSELYSEIYQILKPVLNSSRSLEFIATGTKPISGPVSNTGCDVVKRLVNTLTESGNDSVFGLIDWDGKNEASERVVVLAGGDRNGLENVILDPLLIAALIARDVKASAKSIGLPEDSYINFIGLGHSQLQAAVDHIQRAVLKRDLSPDHKTKILAEYNCGLGLNVDKEYFEMDDHQLEDRVIAAFPFLNEIKKGKTGQLMKYIVGKIMREHPGLIPVELTEAFKTLLNEPAHLSRD